MKRIIWLFAIAGRLDDLRGPFKSYVSMKLYSLLDYYCCTKWVHIRKSVSFENTLRENDSQLCQVEMVMSCLLVT